MADQPAPARPKRWLRGDNLYIWDVTTEEWRQVTTVSEWPCEEALRLFMPLLRGLSEPSFYEWKEGETRYRVERWSGRALEVLRTDDGLWRWRL